MGHLTRPTLGLAGRDKALSVQRSSNEMTLDPNRGPPAPSDSSDDRSQVRTRVLCHGPSVTPHFHVHAHIRTPIAIESGFRPYEETLALT